MRPEAVAVEMIHAGYFRIDPSGQVWRLKKRTARGTDYLLPAAKPIGSSNRDGYMSLRIRINGKGVNVGTHRVVWWLHKGPIPDGLEVNHKDGVKSNNNIDNLELMTHQDNIKHSWRTGLTRSIDPSESPNTTLTWEIVREIRRSFASGEANQPTLARLYGVSQVSISHIINHKRWPDRTTTESAP